LRTESDRQALIEGLANRVIDLIATDHAPHGKVEKDIEFDRAANGVIGLQTCVPLTYRLVLDGQLSLARWVEALTLAPARLLNLELGTLKVGRPADLTVFSPAEKFIFTRENNFSKSENSPFFDSEFTGRVRFTLVEGQIRYES
jgi:dihydroorotase